MDSFMFHKSFDLMDDSFFSQLKIPFICVNKICPVYWSSPVYCFNRWLLGFQDYPVCIRSAVMFNVLQLSFKPKKSKKRYKQLLFDF